MDLSIFDMKHGQFFPSIIRKKSHSLISIFIFIKLLTKILINFVLIIQWTENYITTKNISSINL